MPSICRQYDAKYTRHTKQQAPAATGAMQQLAAAVNAVLADDVAAAVPDL
jgi:hypothetical protein